MIYVFEIIALLVVGAVLISVFMSVGRPMAELFAEKTKYKFSGISSEAEHNLVKRIEALEEELRQAKKQIESVKESAEFAVKLIEDKEKKKQA